MNNLGPLLLGIFKIFVDEFYDDGSISGYLPWYNPNHDDRSPFNTLSISR